MFCQNCGNQIDDNSVFCPYCGFNSQQMGMQQQTGQPQMGAQQQTSMQQMGAQQQMNMQSVSPVYNVPSGKKKMSTGMIVGIICGIAAVIGLAVVLILVLVGDKKDDKKAEKKAEEKTEATTELTEETETEATEATTEATEATTEATTEQAVVSEEDKKKANDGFSNVLNNNEAGIKRYTWQRGYNSNRSTPIAIYDLNSDGIDELIYMEAPNDYTANLHICAYAENNVSEILYREAVDAEVAGGTVFYLAKLEGSDDLLLYHSVSDEGYDEDFELLKKNSSGQYVSDVDYSISAYPNDDYTSMNTTYKKNGSTVAQSEVDSFINEKQGMIETFLLYSEGEDIVNLVNSKKDVSMTLDSARSKLGSSGRETGTVTGQLTTLPFTGEKEFLFASGAGAWSTSLYLNADGSFHGLYGDSDMGDTGDGYPGGTRYYSDFEGKFKNITKIDDNTYKMELDYYTTKQTVGTEEIYEDVLYKYSEPYGVYGGKVFYFYLPDKPVSELSEGFIGWSYGTIGDISNKSKLGVCGIYNEAEDQGLFEYYLN